DLSFIDCSILCSYTKSIFQRVDLQHSFLLQTNCLVRFTPTLRSTRALLLWPFLLVVLFDLLRHFCWIIGFLGLGDLRFRNWFWRLLLSALVKLKLSHYFNSTPLSFRRATISF